MIINITKDVFGGAVRNGDLVGIANIVSHLRKENPEIKFHMLPDAVNSADYVQKFYKFMLKNTDYFSETPGENFLSWKKVNLWDFRDIIGDSVIIPNNLPMEKKVVVFPVFDAPYNVYRNWPSEAFFKILSDIDNDEKYKDYEKIICCNKEIDISASKDWKTSTDFDININHILTTEVFVGGDTGTSHFAWALDRGPKTLIYYNNGRGMMHVLPFYLLQGRGETRRYWLNMEGTTWQ